MPDTNAERIRLLSLVDIFEPLTEEEIENLNGQLPDRRLQRGEIFFGPQDRSERLYLLQSGRVRVFRSTPDGREFTLAVVEAGTVFGEMALTGQQLEGAYAQAMEPSQVSTMLRADLERLILEKPEVGLRIMQLLSERLRRQETRLEDVGMKDVRARLASIIVLLVESEGVRSGTGYRIPSSLHPRAPWDHDRGQPHRRHQGLRAAPGRGSSAVEAASDLRYRHRRPKEIGQLRRCPRGG